jgi:Secretion system C-terminal sorting domain/Two component regulator propeller
MKIFKQLNLLKSRTMKKQLLIIIAFAIGLQTTQAQFPTINPNWTYIRADNTGVGGEQHFVVRGDRFGNMWTGGRMPFWSQGCVTRFDGTTFTNWGTYAENYLPNEVINNIAFDNNDRIWVGTDNGLATSADGLSWQHHTSANTVLQWDQIKGIAIAANNDVWVVTGDAALNGGVGYYNGTSWTFYNSSNSNLPTQQLSDIAIDQNNNKWVTCNLGLLKYDGLNWIQFNSGNSGLSPGAPREVMIDSLNRVWVCNGPNIDIFDGTNWTHLNNTTWPVANFDATNMYIQGNKIILCETTNSSRVMMFDGTNWTWEWTTDFILSCYIDVNGNYWTAGTNSVRKFDGTAWKIYTRHSTALAENFNEDMFVDSKNNKWFANGNGGIQVMECPNWEVYGIKNEGLFPIPQTQSYVGTCITESPDGDIWFSYNGSDGFAVQIPNGDYHNYASWVVWDKTNAHPWFQGIKKIAATDSGKVFFIADYTYNTFMYDKNTNAWTLYDITNGITGWPKCLTAHQGGKMYVGHIGGIDIYDNGIWSAIDLTPVGISYIFDIEFDTNNNMWLATVEGLWKYDGTTWTHWDMSNSNIAATKVTNIKIDTTTNTIYASADESLNFPYYGGISYFNGTGNVFTTFMQGSSPISEKYVRDLDIDTLGNLWIVTAGEGINVYNPNGVLGFECIDKTLQTGGTTNIISQYPSGKNSLSAFPNPFSSTTTLEFNLTETKNVSVSIIDVVGRTVKNISSGNFQSGKNKITIDLSELNSGIYFCKIKSNENLKTIKLSKN